MKYFCYRCCHLSPGGWCRPFPNPFGSCFSAFHFHSSSNISSKKRWFHALAKPVRMTYPPSIRKRIRFFWAIIRPIICFFCCVCRTYIEDAGECGRKIGDVNVFLSRRKHAPCRLGQMLQRRNNLSFFSLLLAISKFSIASIANDCLPPRSAPVSAHLPFRFVSRAPEKLVL